MSDEQVIQDPERSQIEAVAEKMGWNPNYEGENARSAEEFILHSRDIMDSMSKKMRSQGKQLSDLNMAVGELKIHNDTVYKAEVSRLKRELKDLKVKRKEAVENGDNDTVVHIDEQIAEINSVPAPEKPKPQISPEFEDWKEKNEWFDTDKELTEYALTLYDTMNSKDAAFMALPYKRKLKKVESVVKTEFSEKFQKQGKPTPPAGGVEGGGKKPNTTKTFTVNDLPEGMKDTALRFEKLGIMTVKQYIDDQVKAGVLK